MQDTPVIKTVESQSSGERQEWLRALPKELVGLIPEGVWTSLSLEQKKEVLRQNGILDKYSGNSADVVVMNPVPTEAGRVEEAPSSAVGTVESRVESPVVENNSESTIDTKEFNTLVEGIKEIEGEGSEKDSLSEGNLSQEEKFRIEEERASGANMGNYKFFGYQPDDGTVTNAKSVSDNGDVEDGRTWAATLIKKIFAIFGE